MNDRERTLADANMRMPWEQGDMEPTAVLRAGMVRYRITATGNQQDAEFGTAKIVDALNALHVIRSGNDDDLTVRELRIKLFKAGLYEFKR